MQGQIEPAEPLFERMQETFRVLPMFKPDDHIIDIPHDDGVALGLFEPTPEVHSTGHPKMLPHLLPQLN